jgi:4-amino-4-deoxy-L-arabinose transferase-like glycosyltransferase
MTKTIKQRIAAPRTILSLIVIVLFVPFVFKAFHIDDPLYLWVAQHIQHHPFDFYGFSVNWYGETASMSLINKNPPLFSYYLSVVALFFGWSEAAMHLAALIPAIALAVGTYQLAGVMRAEPFTAALIAVCSPVFVLSGTTVMSDIAMVNFWVWAVYLWIRGLSHESKGWISLTAAGLLIAASGLTKYFGVCLVPLLAVYALWRRQPARTWLPFLAVPIVVLALYQWYTIQLYGVGLLTDAAFYAVSKRRLTAGQLGDALLVGLSFTGGGVLAALFGGTFLMGKRGWLATVAGIGISILILYLMKVIDGFNLGSSWPLLLQMAFFVTAGCGLLAAAVDEFRRERDAESMLLACWIFGTFLFACMVNWTVSGRNILPLAPAAGIVIARKVNLWSFSQQRSSWTVLILALILSLGVAISVTVSDYSQANGVRTMVQRITTLRPPGSDIWFQGHWGFQYYLEEAGAKAIDYNRSMAKAGDLIITPSFGSNIIELNDADLILLNIFRTKPFRGVTTLNNFVGAGFYSSRWGPAPYVFATSEPDVYIIQRIRNVPRS